jgi:hypothetical protein
LSFSLQAFRPLCETWNAYLTSKLQVELSPAGLDRFVKRFDFRLGPSISPSSSSNTIPSSPPPSTGPPTAPTTAPTTTFPAAFLLHPEFLIYSVLLKTLKGFMGQSL